MLVERRRIEQKDSWGRGSSSDALDLPIVFEAVTMSSQSSFPLALAAEHFQLNESVDRYDQNERDPRNGYAKSGNNGFYREIAGSYDMDSNPRADSYSNTIPHHDSIDITDLNNNNSNNTSITNLSLTEPRSTHEIGVESLPLSTQQQIEEERLRGDILRYLVGNSNGTYHYSAELRAIIHDVIGIPASTTQTEFSETVTSLLDILHSDPEKRFLVSGAGDNIHIKRCFVRGDEEEISDLVEEWRALIAIFLLESKRSVGLSDIGSSVPRPIRIPTSVKLIFIMKTDPSNRFILKGDGNAAKARYNMQADSYQESVWVDKWRDDIALFLIKQQWSIPSVGLHEIGTHVVRPFFLPPRVKLLDTLQGDPQQRFVILGFGNDTRVMMRDFRVDEPEIEEFIEHWRRLIASYLLSKSAMPGVSQPLLGLSEIGANVPRPPEVPTSVKLIDVMRADPLIRFLIKGDGNALRVKFNSRALDPSGPVYGTPPVHNNFPNKQFLDDQEHRGSGGHPQEGYHRGGQGGPNGCNGGQMERDMMRGPAGFPAPPPRAPEPFGINRGTPPYPPPQHMGPHGIYSQSEMESMQMRRPSHLQMQVQQFHQQNTRQSIPIGGQPALPLAPAMAPSHPYRDRDPRLRRVTQVGPVMPMKRHSVTGGGGQTNMDWTPASSMSLDRPNMAHPHYPPIPPMKQEPSPYSNVYGSSFTSQRTSLESSSISDRDYGSMYGGPSTNNSSSFISQDGLDFSMRKDLAPQTPLTRSFSGYGYPSQSPDTQVQVTRPSNRSFSGFPTDSGMDPSLPKDTFGQYLGFGPIGSPQLPIGGQFKGGFERVESYSSEGTTEDGEYRGTQSAYREREFLEGVPFKRGTSSASQDPPYSDVLRSVSRSSSFGSTLDSLSSYKHVQVDKEDQVRRNAFTQPSPYGVAAAATSFQLQAQSAKAFEPLHGTRYGVGLQEVAEGEEDRESDERRTSRTRSSSSDSREYGTIRNTGGGGGDMYSNYSSSDYMVREGKAPPGTLDAPHGAQDINENSNIDSYNGYQAGMTGAARSSDNDSIIYNSNSISDAVIECDSGSQGEGGKGVPPSAAPSLYGDSNTVSPPQGGQPLSRGGVVSAAEMTGGSQGGEGDYFRAVSGGERRGMGGEEEEREEGDVISRRPSSALSDPTADYLLDDFTLLTTDTNTEMALDRWMIKVWLHIVFSGFDCDIIEGFVNKLRDDGGFVTVQDLLDAQARGELGRDALYSIAGFKVGHCNRLEKSLSALCKGQVPQMN